MNTSNESEYVSSRKSMLRVAAAGFSGTALEYYDFFLYGTAAALVFGPLFFPSYSPLAGTLASFATFAVGFLARPLGSILFGNIGDRLGRRKTLVYSLSLMGIATVLIGALPTFEQVGWWAPLMLVVLRFLQGIAMGGEWGGAALMLVEHAAANRRGLFGSVVQMGAPGGLLLSTLAINISSELSGDSFNSWGWRIPFLLSAVIFVVSMIIRLGVDETPAFQTLDAAQAKQANPLRSLLRNNWFEVGLAAVVIAPGAILFYLVSAYSVSYGTAEVGLSRSTVLNAVVVASFVYLAALPAAGLASDLLSRRTVLLAGCIAAFASGFVLFKFLDMGTFLMAFVGIAVVLSLAHASLQAPQPAFLAGRFAADVRMSGVALSQALSTSMVGGTAPFLATLFYSWTGSTVLISSWIALWSVAAAIALIVLCRRGPIGKSEDMIMETPSSLAQGSQQR